MVIVMTGRLLMNRRIMARFGSSSSSSAAAASTAASAAAAAAAAASPYKVLGVRRSATTDQIKAAFRKLAKQHHPDMKNHRVIPSENNNNSNINNNNISNNSNKNDDDDDDTPIIAMSDILAAYETLMEPAGADGFGDSRVAVACEYMTLDDLKRDSKRYSVYTVQVWYANDNGVTDHTIMDTTTIDNNSTGLNQSNTTSPQDDHDHDDDHDGSSTTMTTLATITTSNTIHQIVVHPDDSVTDFKHILQQKYGVPWGLDQKRRDRHGLATAWEVVTTASQQQQQQQQNELKLLGNHWFLYTYNVNHGDLVHVIVRNNDDENQS